MENVLMGRTAHTPSVVLLTGGAGFIGCNLVRYLLKTDTSLRVVNLDALTYAGLLANLQGVEETYGQRYRFVRANICDQQAMNDLFEEEHFDTVIHLAAETHVDRSIDGPRAFLDTNIMGTYVLLQTALTHWKGRDDVRFHHVSTDEVYGSLGSTGYFTEQTRYDPSGPYSASKASSDHLVNAWQRTYGLPTTLSNCSNNYGPYQFPEKLIPLMISNALQGKHLPVYGDGKNVRDWLFVEDHCQALDVILRQGQTGRMYNVGASNEWTNIDLVRLLSDTMQELSPPDSGHYRDLIKFIPDRPGHDRRYAIDATRLREELGWMPRHTFETGLRETIQWYLANSHWLDEIRKERYSGDRLGLIS